MNLDDLLQSRIDEVARAVEPPSPDTASIRRRGQRVRQRRRATVAAGLTVAAVAAAAVATGGLADLGRDNSAADPGPKPSYDDGLPVWSDGQSIYVGSTVIEPSSSIGSFSLTAEYVVYTDTTGVVYRQSSAQPATELAEGAFTGAVGDPQGVSAAWIDEQSTNPELVVMDVSTGDELRRVDLGPVSVTIQESMVSEPPPIVSVDADTVYYIANGHLWTYDYVEDSEPKPSPLDSDAIVDADNDVLAVSGNSGTVEFRQPDGSVVRPTITMEADGWLSSDGRLFLGFGAGGIVVADTATGEANVVDLDGRFGFSGGWAYGNTVMLISPDITAPAAGEPAAKSGEMLACNPERLTCHSVGSAKRFTSLAVPSL